ncbi:hypothetical protein GF402_05960 [Candidatus Fermentibacteria bacterium]|nr:hypothetical protein [Candidatus Fermentibacteria bacterium]
MITRRFDTPVALGLLAFAVFGLAFAILHGPLYLSLAWLMVGLAVVMDPGSGQLRAVPAVLLALSAATGSPEAASTLVFAAAAAILLFTERRWPWRSVCLAAALLAVIPSRVGGMVVPLAGLALACVFDLRWLRLTVLAVSMLAAPLVGGMPFSTVGDPRVLQERFQADSTIWRDPVSLDYNRRTALLRTSGCSEPLHLVLQAGGVRDTLPLGTVTRDGYVVSVNPGRDTLMVPPGSGETVVMMERTYRPFRHPVIHLTEAWTGRAVR